MIFRTFHKPVASEQITSQGSILNGRASLRDALQIPQANLLFSNVQNCIQPPLDPVLASHTGFSNSRRNSPAKLPENG